MIRQYRRRRINDQITLIPAPDMIMLRNKDGHTYLIDGPRTWLIHEALPEATPANMANGLYRDENRTNIIHLHDRHGLRRLRLIPASIIHDYDPWRQVATRIPDANIPLPQNA
ncbi:hypothetical protein [Bifidobacterium sp. SO1]|uniref:hypothetical protein n=1 Tax=Bifidobacterium sp. SO1 TaxID=2809029 RepID=UPI001BDCE4EA|nr:hypothetical protein [Bifidobacterium sp. SO1]MBT1161753.1 hypothetical protein [Bifidobacterium sp. SO1]